MKSYCVKQKKLTECMPGSERHVKDPEQTTMHCARLLLF